MQIFSTDQTIRGNTVLDSKELKSESLATQARKGEQLVSMMLAMKKAFDLLGDDLVELSTKNESVKNKIGYYYERWLEESKAKLLKQIVIEKRASLIIIGMKTQKN